ncbi:hypothetical protein GCM10009837_67610 [Streptomyces durmitorensis]|uniref:Uncharacterized protein n=1 Tax=Streptomyces durmitorensis TaxID=319947 RepID=A0ABY4Q763_9ACTN|nr:hypothetical protein [Streptomyces durmitorensis]UQT61240.1 hypothetical protein M4V62_42650 [Streptomyces durmitorensis]
MEGLAATLAGLGVTVYRPLPLPRVAAPIAGLGWEDAPTPALNIRDNTLVLGNQIIETPPAIRSRYLETRLLAPAFTAYCHTDVVGAGPRVLDGLSRAAQGGRGVPRAAYTGCGEWPTTTSTARCSP